MRLSAASHYDLLADDVSLLVLKKAVNSRGITEVRAFKAICDSTVPLFP